MLETPFGTTNLNKVELYCPETAFASGVDDGVVFTQLYLLQFPESAKVAIVILFLA